MRLAVLIATLALAGSLAAIWAAGGFGDIATWAAERQREAQNAIARGLRALRGGEPGALAALLGLAFAYGFFHAAGPGHGKVLIGGYGLARKVGALKLSAVAVLSSLAQATAAVVLVYLGVLIFDWTRENVVGVTEDWLAPVSYGAIAAIGFWLALRGGMRLARSGPAPAAAQAGGHAHHPDRHGHAHDAAGHACSDCGHRHGPTVEEVARLDGWRDAALLIGGIALRPCTGAVFLLILTWSMGIPLAGILGAYVMGLGTATVTVVVALSAVWLREGLSFSLSGTPAARIALPLVELLAGGVVLLVALQLLMRSI
jgi:nickel/cobalt transporter (NicO) family protein